MKISYAEANYLVDVLELNLNAHADAVTIFFEILESVFVQLEKDKEIDLFIVEKKYYIHGLDYKSIASGYPKVPLSDDVFIA